MHPVAGLDPAWPRRLTRHCLAEAPGVTAEPSLLRYAGTIACGYAPQSRRRVCRRWPHRCMLVTRDAMNKQEDRVSSSAELSPHEGARHVHDAPAQFQRAADGDESDEDTIELSLTPEHALALSRAAEEEHAEALPVASRPADVPGSQTGNAEHQSSRRSRRSPLAFATLASGVAIGVALGLAVHLVPHVRTVTIKVPVSMPAPATPLPATFPAELQEPPVQLRNPFDRSEVFEYPPGTSADEARRSAAALLLQRARDRLGAESPKGNPPTPNTVGGRAAVARNSGT